MIGKGNNVELFKNVKYNIHENNDLRALERRLPKGWKKPKWTARTSSLIYSCGPLRPPFEHGQEEMNNLMIIILIK